MKNLLNKIGRVGCGVALALMPTYSALADGAQDVRAQYAEFIKRYSADGERVTPKNYTDGLKKEIIEGADSKTEKLRTASDPRLQKLGNELRKRYLELAIALTPVYVADFRTRDTNWDGVVDKRDAELAEKKSK